MCGTCQQLPLPSSPPAFNCSCIYFALLLQGKERQDKHTSGLHKHTSEHTQAIRRCRATAFCCFFSIVVMQAQQNDVKVTPSLTRAEKEALHNAFIAFDAKQVICVGVLFKHPLGNVDMQCLLVTCIVTVGRAALSYQSCSSSFKSWASATCQMRTLPESSGEQSLWLHSWVCIIEPSSSFLFNALHGQDMPGWP